MVELGQSIDVGGVPFRVSNLEDAADWLTSTAKARDGSRSSVRLANAYCVALASKQQSYGELMRSRGVNLPDGLPVVAVMKVTNRHSAIPRRVRGPSFFREALQRGLQLGVRHAFLGGSPTTLARLQSAVRSEFPGVQIVGAYSPPFADPDESFVAELVHRTRAWDADIVWVGLGTPKQDFIAQALADQAGVMAVGVGAAFDFVAGTVDEAPRWIQRSGFEWAHRLIKEPRRLWRRYVFGNLRFIYVVGRHALSARSVR